MNEHELDRALGDLYAHRTAGLVDLPILHQRAIEVPAKTRQPRSWMPALSRRFGSRFSASALLVGGVIVALFGGFLLSAALTRPSDEAPPAVGASATATPQASMTLADTDPTQPPATATLRSDILPGVDLWVQQITPGVFRVMADTVGHDLTTSLGSDRQLALGQDGSAWIRELSRDPSTDQLFQLGHAATYDAWRLSFRPDITVAPDGTVWALGRAARTSPEAPGTGQLFSLSDGVWSRHPVPKGVKVTGIEVGTDGSVWATWSVGHGSVSPCGAPREDGPAGGALAVGRLVDGAWQEESVEPATVSGDGGSLAIGPDGSAVLGVSFYGPRPPCHAWAGLLERGDESWMAVRSVDPPTHFSGVGPVAIGSDGTAWAYLADRADPADPSVDWWFPRLLRRSDGEWAVLGDDDSVPMLVGPQEWGSSLAVSPDGTLWTAFEGWQPLDRHREWGKSFLATLDGPCVGVLSFDGQTWGQHLPNACTTNQVSAAPDGSIWVSVGQSRDPDALPGGVYVIEPEVVMSTE